MKIIHTIIIAFLMLFGAALFPNQTEAAVCQNKTVIVYGNGIFNTPKMAFESMKTLKKKLNSYPQASPYLAEFEYKLAYADNGGATGPFSLAGMAQLHQAFVQRRAASDSLFWRWLGGLAVAPAWFKTMMNNQATATNAGAYVNNATLRKQLTGDPANPSLQPGYRALLNQGMRVIIVAHSQGNFYANAAYDGLTAQKPAWAASLGIVAVASPDSRVAGGGPHITVPEDEIITAVWIFYPSTLSSTPANGFSKNMTELGGLAAWAQASFGHNFVQWYLAGTDTRTLIFTGIINARNTLQPAAYDMVPQRVTAGTRVVPDPKGGIYVTKVGGGVILIDANGVVKPVPGLPRVDFADAANNLYYSDVAIDPLNWRTAATTIYKMDVNGIVSTVYNTKFQGAGSRSFNAINSYDVAADGTVYVLEGANFAYKVKNGVTSKIAGAPPIHGKFLLILNRARIGGVAIDSYFGYLASIREMVNGSVLMTSSLFTGAWGGPFSYAVDASGMISPLSVFPMSHGNFDVCSNGTVVGDAGGASGLGGGVFVGWRTNVSSVALSQDGNDLYYVDTLTSSVMKLAGRSR